MPVFHDLASLPALFTGFPGFLCARLLLDLARIAPDAPRVLLVQPHMIALARTRIDSLARLAPSLAHVEILPGDITDPQLGFDDATTQRLATSIRVVWHLAALYDLAVKPEIAYKVNVLGTMHVLDFCGKCSDLARFNYISTCYVSGNRTGTILESELDQEQGHKNHYEQTKFWAEVEVQRRMGSIPTAIFRPGIVVGDSVTGETDKYDGPYYVFRLLERLPSWLTLPHIGRGDALVNLVPIDFVSAAMSTLGTSSEHHGQTFHLADPNPMRARDILARALDYYGRPPARGMIPSAIVERAMRATALERALGVPRESIMYFNHDARYDTTNAQRALRPTPIRCPHLSSYMHILLDYMALHPDKPFLDGRRI
jgi:thioester reductase-like protein